MKLTMRDRVIVLIFILAALFYAGYQTLWLPATAKIATLETQKTEVQGLTADISPLLKQTETLNTEKQRLQNAVEDVKIKGGKTLAKEEFLLYLGQSSTKNSVKLLGFNDLGTEETGEIYKAKFDFELQGTTSNINKMLTDIDNMGVKYSVGSVSFRQMAGYDYLKRFFDDITKLPWYKEPEKKEEETAEPLPDDVIEALPSVVPENIPPTIHEQTPTVQPIPEQAPAPTPAPTEEQKEKNITDRLNELLEQTRFGSNYNVVFFTNTQAIDDTQMLDTGSEMRLAVTVCFLMFDKPDISNSFLTKKSEGI